MTGFDTDMQVGDVRVSVDNGLSIVAGVVTGTLFASISGTVDNTLYASAIDDLVTDLNNVSAGWSGGYTFNTNTFFLSSSIGFKLTFSAIAKRAFGFEDQTSFVQFTTSSTDPFYIWISQEAAITQDSEIFEIDIPYRESVTDDGRTFGLPMQGNSGFSFLGQNNQDGFTLRDWEFTNELIWHVFSAASSSQTPYTWQEHVQYARSYHPWALFEFNSASVAIYEDRKATYRFRGNEAAFKPRPMFSEQSAYWIVDVKTRQLSRGTNFGTEPFEED